LATLALPLALLDFTVNVARIAPRTMVLTARPLVAASAGSLAIVTRSILAGGRLAPVIDASLVALPVALLAIALRIAADGLVVGDTSIAALLVFATVGAGSLAASGFLGAVVVLLLVSSVARSLALALLGARACQDLRETP